MTKEATREYVIRMAERYLAMKNKKAKGRILDDFCATTWLNRKHAIKKLRGKKKACAIVGRKPKYGADVAGVLKEIWLAANQPCSKLMQPILDCYVTSYEKMHGALGKVLRRQVLGVSPSSIDRLLKSARLSGLRRRRSPLGLAAVKRQVPIRAGEWNVKEPGWIEADTVGHGGGSVEGSFVWSLTMTDILTQWTEIRVMWCRGAAGTFTRIREVEDALPFSMLGFDSDNGPEFMNWHLLSYAKGRSPALVFTRSRAYHKNDNAHVEQKNGTHVRGLLGHERIDDSECVESLNQALILWSRWKNLFSPVMKLISKTREGHRYKKVYDKPRTPAQRSLECAAVSSSEKRALRKLIATTDCFSLKRDVDNHLKEVFNSIRKRQESEVIGATAPAARTSALRAAPPGSVVAAGAVGIKCQKERLSISSRVIKQPTRMVS